MLNEQRAEQLLVCGQHEDLRKLLREAQGSSTPEQRAIGRLYWVESLLARGQCGLARHWLIYPHWPTDWAPGYEDRLRRARVDAANNVTPPPRMPSRESIREPQEYEPSALVVCPHCRASGSISMVEGKPVFECPTCRSRFDTWQGPIILWGKCETCGRQIRKPNSLPDGIGTSATMVCPQGHTSHVPVTVTRVDASRQDPPLDPLLGLELALAARTKSGWIWALNQDHLLALRCVVASPVRTPATRGSEWVGRLPSWVTSSANREAVLRVIDRLSKSAEADAPTSRWARHRPGHGRRSTQGPVHRESR